MFHNIGDGMMLKIAVLGPKGTFSELAYEKYFQDKKTESFFYSTIEQTFDALETTEYAIVPIENTLDGYIQQTLDFMLEKNTIITDEIFIPVQFGLIGNINSIQDIKKIYVQFVARGQCQKFIKSLGDVKQILTDSNMESYHMIPGGAVGDAAIVPAHMVANYSGFSIPEVTDSTNNYTRFLVLSKRQKAFEASIFKVSLVVVPIIDRPGLLYDILGIFKKYNINLTSIMSRPTKTEMGNYNFYIEMKSIASERDQMDQAFLEIKKDFFIKILGVYPSRN